MHFYQNLTPKNFQNSNFGRKNFLSPPPQIPPTQAKLNVVLVRQKHGWRLGILQKQKAPISIHQSHVESLIDFGRRGFSCVNYGKF